MQKIETHARFLLLATLAAVAAGCSDSAEAHPVLEAPPAVHAGTVTAEARDVAENEIATGTLVADHSAPVAADAAGKVIALYVDRGDRVKAGQPLARLDVRDAALGAREARAQLASAESQAELARIECARSESLYAKNAITRAQLDHETAQCKSSAGSVDAARARVSMAGKQIGDGLIRAPFAGVISERLVEVGEYLRPESRIAVLVDADPMRVVLAIPESLIGSIAIGHEVHFTTLSQPGRTYSATVTAMAAELDPVSRSLDVEAEVRKGDGLLPGMFIAAELPVRPRSLPVVPRAALRQNGSTWRVFAVVDGTLEERIVHLADGGAATGDTVAITDGLSSGEVVASPLSPELVDGTRIQ